MVTYQEDADLYKLLTSMMNWAIIGIDEDTNIIVIAVSEDALFYYNPDNNIENDYRFTWIQQEIYHSGVDVAYRYDAGGSTCLALDGNVIESFSGNRHKRSTGGDFLGIPNYMIFEFPE